MTSMACPSCGERARSVPLRTVKSLLTGAALSRLHPDDDFHFCATPGCEVVYFSAQQSFDLDDVRVPVFQKDASSAACVCYCFDWTREALVAALHRGARPDEEIQEHVRERRCACDLRNPQGTCCLGNVRSVLAHARQRSQGGLGEEDHTQRN
ncbi:putative iron-sulfur cluster-binding metallochaperone [Alicyclobacillus vulcanalis]|uniref:CopZ zinc binding domain-containing protein n=1 Tax=Alicyclobacillus vulcanalis TaxID=252246 RepID=A0A1N7K9F2_9BACL|nr:copper chaperone Copz family protein [Alicyclobacillus vulcanalis]SIS58205.1 hypothetical protein SAMN05421799_101423 [Alicyclobacillus vulcanalis]